MILDVKVSLFSLGIVQVLGFRAFGSENHGACFVGLLRSVHLDLHGLPNYPPLYLPTSHLDSPSIELSSG